MARILIIDDDRSLCEMLCSSVRRIGHVARYALSIGAGVQAAGEENWDVVFLDVGLPDGNGLDALPVIRSLRSSPEVIIFTGEGDPDGAETAIQRGAWDYVEKPFSLNAMILPLIRALDYRAARRNRRVEPLVRKGIVGSSPEVEKCLEVVGDASRSEEPVLIVGETGTGKEIFARAIHENSLRAEKEFVVVDCAALPETLAESILFGHEKGAFTGAGTARTGLVKEAHGGSLFLDEVGELPLSLQKKFLRVLQEKSFRPLGSRREVRSDFRLLSATNRDLDELVRKGRFREDLFYRIKSWGLFLPPLRERMGDIMELALHRLAIHQRQTGGGTKGFSPEFIETLTIYHWPGNVRELLKSLETAFENSRGEPTLYPTHLPAHIRVHVTKARLSRRCATEAPSEPTPSLPKSLPPLKEYREKSLASIEAGYLHELMRVSNGDIREACRISGLSRSRLYRLLQEAHIDPTK